MDYYGIRSPPADLCTSEPHRGPLSMEYCRPFCVLRVNTEACELLVFLHPSTAANPRVRRRYARMVLWIPPIDDVLTALISLACRGGEQLRMPRVYSALSELKAREVLLTGLYFSITGGGVLLPAGRGDPAVAGRERDACPKGAGHAGGPGSGGGSDTSRAAGETSIAGVPGAPIRLEKVLPGDVQEEGKAPGDAHRPILISPVAFLRRNRIFPPLMFPKRQRSPFRILLYTAGIAPAQQPADGKVAVGFGVRGGKSSEDTQVAIAGADSLNNSRPPKNYAPIPET